MMTQIGRYEIQSELGRGAVATAFHAIDPAMGRPVTVQLLSRGIDKSAYFQEAAAAAKLDHKNIVTIYELGEHQGKPFIAMQYLQGEDLRNVIDSRRPLSLLRKMLIMDQVADALQSAHASGAVHLDLRPGHILLLPDGAVKITDFGLARLTAQSAGSSRGPAPSDGVAYLAPEQFMSAAGASALSDIFIYGAIYYELLTGKHPFQAGAIAGVMFQIVHEDPVAVRSLDPECPEALERIVHRALDKDGELRYQSLEDLRFDVAPILIEQKQRRAAELLAEAQRLLSEERLDEAQSAVREVLELEPGNRDSRPLGDAIREQIRRRAMRPRVESLLQQAAAELADRRFADAVAILESALQLDGGPGIQARLKEARAALERNRAAARLVTEARQLQDQDPAQAQAAVCEALAMDPENTEAAGLLEGIRFQEKLAVARGLLAEQVFDRAKAILLEMESGHPGQEEVAHWLAQARAGKAKQEAAERARTEREQAVGEAVARCGELQREGRLAEALELVESVSARYSGQAILLELRKRLEAEWQEEKRAAAVRQAAEEAQWLREHHRPELAAVVLEEQCGLYAGEEELERQLADARREADDKEEQEFIEETLALAAALEQQRQFGAVVAVLEAAVERYPGSADVAAAADRLRNTLRDADRQKKLVRTVEAIERSLAKQAWPNALSLIEEALVEFPGEPALPGLLERARAWQRGSFLHDTIARAQACLSDGDLEQAEQILRRALESSSQPEELHALEEELARQKDYRSELRAAGTLLGQRRFQEAEKALRGVLASKPDDNDARLLLNTACAAGEADQEKRFYTGGCAEAGRLIAKGRLDEAADLLRNLLLLFPGDLILERELRAALGDRSPGAGEHQQEPALDSEPEPDVVSVAAPDAAPERTLASRWKRPAILAALAGKLRR